MRSFALLLLVALTASAQQDSPLVAAAKRSKQKTKKPAIVITNETLKRSGAKAHITTTAKQAPLPTIPAAAPTTAPVPEQKVERPAAPKRPKGHPRDDAEITEGDERGDLVSCPSCLPILEPSATLPLQKAEPSKNPPHVVPPQSPQTVPARTPEAPPPQ